MKLFKSFIVIVVIGLILLGIVYSFLLSFTPAWLDRVVLGAVLAAFLIAMVMSRKRGQTDDDKGPKSD